MNGINYNCVIASHIYIYVYAFTTSDTLGEVLETKTSEYNYLVWKDRLSSFNGKAVKYDNAGNPTSYDGKTYKWDGRNLKEIALADGSKTQFEYDQDGLRTQKRQYKADGGLNYFVDYIWEDGKLTYQYLTLAVYITNSQGVTTMRELGPITSKIIYDDSGLPQGFMINDGAEYAFVRNLQGDVIAMVDQNGETVMEYSYDPWGKIEYHLSDESLTEQDAALITALCPLTYRGYNYDFTTGLYYLQSRYYNPEWGRFLNCDDTNILLTTQGETHNANLFAYCDNNPVNKVDYTGYVSDEFIKNIIMILHAAIIMDKAISNRLDIIPNELLNSIEYNLELDIDEKSNVTNIEIGFQYKISDNQRGGFYLSITARSAYYWNEYLYYKPYNYIDSKYGYNLEELGYVLPETGFFPFVAAGFGINLFSTGISIWQIANQKRDNYYRSEVKRQSGAVGLVYILEHYGDYIYEILDNNNNNNIDAPFDFSGSNNTFVKPNNSIVNPSSSLPYALKFRIIRSISKKGWE